MSIIIKKQAIIPNIDYAILSHPLSMNLTFWSRWSTYIKVFMDLSFILLGAMILMISQVK